MPRANAQQDTREAGEILALMTQAYRDSKTYVDSGVVKTVYITPGGGGWTDEMPFTTVFVRPDRFRFEFEHRINPMLGGSARFIVWRQGAQIQTWWGVQPGVQTQRSLAMVIAGATGVSGGSAHTIPALLLRDEIRGWRLPNLQDTHRIPDSMLGNVNCFRVQGKHDVDVMTIWIDSRTFLVRRIDGGHVFENFRTEVTTTYEPVINGPVSDDKLAFNPPK